jgi:phage anti-repressor protein
MSLTIDKLNNLIDINNDMLPIKNLLNKINYPYNELYIDKFWDNITNDKWIYIDNNMLQYIGYSEHDINSSKRAYIIVLKDNFDENSDYKMFNNKEFKENAKCMMMHLENIDVNHHNKTKHLIVSPDCFKQSLMLLKTEKAKEIKRYYIELEKIFKFYLQYQAKYQELKTNQINNELTEEKNKNSYLSVNAFNYVALLMKEFLYIATTYSYAYQNNFKIGKTNNLTQRLSQYNTSHNKYQKYYYVFISEPTYYAKAIEYILKHILAKYRNSDTNEI